MAQIKGHHFFWNLLTFDLRQFVAKKVLTIDLHMLTFDLHDRCSCRNTGSLRR